MFDVNRRKVLCGSGVALTTVLAGCTGSLGGGDSGPQYDEDDHDDLLLAKDDFEDEDFHRDDEINEHFDAVFANEDETIILLTEAEVEEDIETAENSFETSKSGMRDPVDYEIGDEAFWDTENDELAVTIFRHSNAVGQVAAMRQSGMEVQPDKTRSQEYARTMFEGWSDI